MITGKLVQSILKQRMDESMVPRSFQPGQIINGKVNKLFPNQTAEVVIGNQKLIAQLEAPLAANDRYWFQVQHGEGKVFLRVLQAAEGLSGDKGGSLEGVLRQLTIHPNKDHLELLRFFIKEQLPISKDGLLSSFNWLESSGRSKENYEVIKQVALKNLPLTNHTFNAVRETVHSESMNTTLEKLFGLLGKESLSETGKQLLGVVYDISVNEKKKLSDQAVTQLLKTWLNGSKQGESRDALAILQKVQFISTIEEEVILRQVAQRIIEDSPQAKNFHVNSSKDFTLIQELIHTHQSGKQSEFTTLLQQLLSSKNKLADHHLLQQLKQVKNSGTPITYEKTLNLVLKDWMLQQLHESDGKNLKNVSHQLLLLLGSNTNQNQYDSLSQVLLDSKKVMTGTTQSEQALLTKISTTLASELTDWENGRFVSEHLKQLVKTLGFTHEKDVVSFLKAPDGPVNDESTTLKSLLIKYLNENPPLPLKEVSEKLLNKITGMQLLSQELGPMQQYITQVPLAFWNQTVDLTLQWSGRRQENGEIDPNYCRVLFYLELEFLNETIIDLQVQNRIINITVVNDTESIKSLASPFINVLKESLSALNYKLSSVDFEKTTTQKKQKPFLYNKIYHSSTYSGVDFRI